MKKLFLLLLFTTSICLGAFAQSEWVGINSAKENPSEINLIEDDLNKTKIGFYSDGYSSSIVKTPEGDQEIIKIPGAVQITEKGAPELPKLTTTIVIPDLDEMQISVISSNYKEFHDVSVAPSKGHIYRNVNPDDVPYTYGAAYEKDAFYPGNLAKLEEPFIMRDFRGQTISVFPIQYNPVSKTLRVYTDITIEVTSSGKEGVNPLYRERSQISLEPEFGSIYDNFFLNMEKAAKSYPVLEGEEGSLLIICYDDFIDAMQPFVDWKRTIGRKTEIVPLSEAGSNATEVKSFVADYYTNNADFAYLLLIGDGPQIPPVSTSSGASDNAYGYLEGSDNYNEIFVGRFSAENVSHVETQVQRMIEYERDVTEADTWLGLGIGVARNEGAGGGHNGGEADYVHMDYIRDTLMNFTYDDLSRRYDGGVPGVPNATAADISGDINDGASVINYCNHGSTTGWSVANYNSSHVDNLTNVGKLPFIWAVACVNGNFVGNLCFAETWLRATDAGEPAGAIGMLASTINQLWQPPMTGQDEMNSILSEESTVHGDIIIRTYGGVSTNGSMHMIPTHGSGGIETHDTWVLFGDPTLMVRTQAPEVFSATYNPVLFLGLSSFDVTVNDADGARVAITITDNDEVVILGTAIVEGGTATVQFEEPLSVPGTATLAITGFNKVTYLNEELSIIPPEGPYVTFNGYELDDISGNNNGVAEYEELISLDVNLKNVGVETAEGVHAEISTESEYVSIINNSYTWGDLNEDEEVVIEDVFSFQVDYVIPDNQTVIFNMIITDDHDNTWESSFSLKIYSPQFSISEYVFDDSELGDGNGRMDPGEKALLTVRYTNTGGAYAMAPVSELIAASPYLTITEQIIEHDIIPAGEFIDVDYEVEANASVPDGTLLNLIFSIADGHYFESEQSIIIGQAPEIIIGEGTASTTYYPFYNYYKGNRSQMLYRADEIGLGEKIITELGLDIKNITSTSQHQVLPNFKILIKHTDIASIGSSFISMDDAVVVFNENDYQMPTEEIGWHFWDIENFEYDGSSNLIIEIVWGLLDSYCSYNDHYSVGGTSMGSTRVAYGYSDTNTSPGYSGNSSLLPNLYLTFAADDIAEEKGVTFIVNDTDELIVDNAKVQIGSLAQYTNEQGITAYQLYPGEYSYLITKEQYQDNYGTFSVSNQDVTVNVTMLPHGTDVTDFDDEFGLVVYPNPTRNLINVQLNAQDSKIELELINYLGQIVERTSVITATGQTELQFNLNGLAKGLYYLKADIDGEVITKKIILQ